MFIYHFTKASLSMKEKIFVASVSHMVNETVVIWPLEEKPTLALVMRAFST